MSGIDRIRTTAVSAVITAVLLASVPAHASDARIQRRDNDPTAAAMVGDLVIARPIGAAMTVVGTAAFIVGLPFIALGGNVPEAAENLVLGPAGTTFTRCLGCTKQGFRRDYENR